MEASRGKLQHVYLSITEGTLVSAAIAHLAIEMPSLRIHTGRVLDAVQVDTAAWGRGPAFVGVDRELARSGANALAIRGPAAQIPRVAIEVLTRCQRFVDRRNEASASAVWDSVRDAHERLHDCTKPLVAADLDHAVDTWQWVVRLSPKASLAVQLAALFHDVERLESEADRRVEQHAPDYAVFKARHARRGADRAYEVLRTEGVDDVTAYRVRELVAVHERRGHDREVDLLNDADALSFFSLNSPGYADYFGPEQTRKKVEYTLARLGAEARRKLATTVRLRDDIRAHLAAEAWAARTERPGLERSFSGQHDPTGLDRRGGGT
jgi:hypothetical protein